MGNNPKVMVFEGVFSKEGLKELKDWWQKNRKQIFPILPIIDLSKK